MPFKKDENGALVLNENGFPIYVDQSGTEKPYDVDARVKQIAELTEKASRRGQELDDLKAKYKLLDGIDDLAAYVEKAKKDAEAVAAMADKDKDAEATIQKRIAEAIKSAMAPLEQDRDKLKTELAKTMTDLGNAVISNAFSNSRYAKEKLCNPALAQQLFASKFYIKDGKPIGRDEDGKDIYGMEGIASFDEALQKLVDKSPFREDILRPTPGGSGAKESENKRSQGGLTAEQAEALSMADYMKARKEGRI